MAAKDNIRIINGTKIDLSTNRVINGTIPVAERFYNSSSTKAPSCRNGKTDRFQNVEWFSPVINDWNERVPDYNPDWEVRTTKEKKLIRIDFPDKYLDYYKRQRDFILGGRKIGGVEISGDMYFYLNFWRLKAKKIGKGFIPPMFLDVTYMVDHYIHDAMAHNAHANILKRRQIGNTEFLGAMGAVRVLFHPTAEVVYASGEEKKARLPFDKCRNGIEQLHPSNANAGREFYKRVYKTDEDGVWFGFRNNQGIVSGYNSHLTYATLMNSAEAMSGLSPVLAILDETGLIKHLLAAVGFVDPSMRENGMLDNRMIIANGTGGDMEDGIEQCIKLFYNGDKYGFHMVDNVFDPNAAEGSKCGLFIPGYYYFIIDNDGNSYTQESIIVQDEHRAKIKDDKDRLHKYNIAYPRTPAEAFTTSSETPFNQAKLTHQQKVILENNLGDLIQRGRFEPILNSKNKIVGAEWIPAPQGEEFALDADGDEMYPMEIIEQPQFPKEKMDFKVMYDEERYTNLYGAGTDSYDREKAHEKPSKLGFSIAKGYLNPDSTSNMFVCFMEWRPSKRDKVYQQTALACIYYGCDNLIEYSNLLIFEWYEKYNLQFLLRERPSWVYANVQNSKMDNRYGVDPATKSYWESDYAEYIENYCDNMWYHKQVHRALTYRKGKNDDLTCSNMLAWQNIKDKIHKNETARASNRSDSEFKDASLFVTVHTEESIIKDIF